MQADSHIEVETITVKEAGQALGRSRPWLREQVRAGRIQVVQQGKKGRGHTTLYLRSDIEHLRQAMRSAAGH